MNWLKDSDAAVQASWQERILAENKAWNFHQKQKFDYTDSEGTTGLDSNSNYFTAMIISDRPKRKIHKSINQQYSGLSSKAYGDAKVKSDKSAVGAASHIDRFSQQI